MKISELIVRLKAAMDQAGDDAEVYLDTEGGQSAYVPAYGVSVEHDVYGSDVIIGGVKTQ